MISFNFKHLRSILFYSLILSAWATDHNEPNSVNGIFADVDSDATDLYGLFAFPGKIERKGIPYSIGSYEIKSSEEALDSLVVIMTFAPEPATGVFDPDVKHVISLNNVERVDVPNLDMGTLKERGEGLADALESRVKNLFSRIKNTAQIEVSYLRGEDNSSAATLKFKNFPYVIPDIVVPANETIVYSERMNNIAQQQRSYIENGVKRGLQNIWSALTVGYYMPDMTYLDHRHVDNVPRNHEPLLEGKTRKEILESPLGLPIRVFVGGRDDPFFTDLNGFFRSIRYRPYLDKAIDNKDFNLKDALKENDPSVVDLKKIERGTKSILEMSKKDSQNGNQDPYWRGADGSQLSMTYSGRDDRAGYNVNAIAIEIPLKLLSKETDKKRLVRVWGEGFRLKAKDHRIFRGTDEKEEDSFVRVDTLGIPFVDTVLGQRQEKFNSGYNNLGLQTEYIKRLIHFGWAFAPGLEKAGFSPCFHQNQTDFPVNKDVLTADIPRYTENVNRCLLQRIRMPNDSWKKDPSQKILPPVVYQLFFPNTLTVDLDTTGTWPFGRRPEDQVASRFTSLFLDYNKTCGKITGNEHRCHVDSFQAKPANNAVRGLPINPVANDVPFMTEFPYLGEAHAREYEKRTKDASQ